MVLAGVLGLGAGRLASEGKALAQVASSMRLQSTHSPRTVHATVHAQSTLQSTPIIYSICSLARDLKQFLFFIEGMGGPTPTKQQML